MVEKFLKIGFEVSYKDWFFVILKRDNWRIHLREKSAIAETQKGNDIYGSVEKTPEEMLKIFSENRENELQMFFLF